MSRSRNRLGITARFDRTEQKHLEMMCAYFKADPKNIIKLALRLLYESTNNLKKEEKNENNNNTESATTGMSAEEIEQAINPDGSASNSSTGNSESDEVQQDSSVHVQDNNEDNKEAE